MATAENVVTFSAEAGSAITIYRFIALAADGQFDHVGAADGFANGVSAEAASAAGDMFAAAQLQGKMKVEAGAAVSVGDKVGSDASGRAITSGGATGDWVLGTAKTAASAAGDVIEVLLQSPAELN